MATETLNPEEKKKRKKKILFRKSDVMDDFLLIENSRTWHALFVEHLAEFSGFSTAFDAAYAADWLAMINDFEKHPTDETMRDKVEEKEADLEPGRKLLRLNINEIEFYVKRAFTEKQRKEEEFGFEKLRKRITEGEGRWALAANMVQKMLVDYAPELAAANMPAGLPAQYENALSVFGNAEVDMEYAQRLRIRATTARIEKFNALFDKHMDVKKAAEIIFNERPDILKQFV
jgi:hypothetical protein